MNYPKRELVKTKPENMVNVDTQFLRTVCREKGFNMSETSLIMGYCADYLSNAITDGRINKDHLKMLSDVLGFPYKKALAKKTKRKKAA